MKKLLLIGLAVGGLAFVAGERADAQITAGLPGVGGLSFGFPGYRYAYPRRYNYYPYGYYQRPYLLLCPAVFVPLLGRAILLV